MRCPSIACAFCDRASFMTLTDVVIFASVPPPFNIFSTSLFFSCLAHFKFTLSMLLASKDHPHGCQLCVCDVGGYPSIGIPTDEKDDRGYTVWENNHGVFSHCAGARS
ncbi:unnamed protein product, partial [Pylaiella littoralis]